MKIRLFCLLSITSLIDASAQDTGNNGEFKRVDFMPKGEIEKIL